MVYDNMLPSSDACDGVLLSSDGMYDGVLLCSGGV